MARKEKEQIQFEKLLFYIDYKKYSETDAVNAVQKFIHGRITPDDAVFGETTFTNFKKGGEKTSVPVRIGLGITRASNKTYVKKLDNNASLVYEETPKEDLDKNLIYKGFVTLHERGYHDGTKKGGQVEQEVYKIEVLKASNPGITPNVIISKGDAQNLKNNPDDFEALTAWVPPQKKEPTPEPQPEAAPPAAPTRVREPLVPPDRTNVEHPLRKYELPPARIAEERWRVANGLGNRRRRETVIVTDLSDIERLGAKPEPKDEQFPQVDREKSRYAFGSNEFNVERNTARNFVNLMNGNIPQPGPNDKKPPKTPKEDENMADTDEQRSKLIESYNSACVARGIKPDDLTGKSFDYVLGLFTGIAMQAAQVVRTNEEQNGNRQEPREEGGKPIGTFTALENDRKRRKAARELNGYAPVTGKNDKTITREGEMGVFEALNKGYYVPFYSTENSLFGSNGWLALINNTKGGKWEGIKSTRRAKKAILKNAYATRLEDYTQKTGLSKGHLGVIGRAQVRWHNDMALTTESGAKFDERPVMNMWGNKEKVYKSDVKDKDGVVQHKQGEKVMKPVYHTHIGRHRKEVFIGIGVAAAFVAVWWATGITPWDVVTGNWHGHNTNPTPDNSLNPNAPGPDTNPASGLNGADKVKVAAQMKDGNIPGAGGGASAAAPTTPTGAVDPTANPWQHQAANGVVGGGDKAQTLVPVGKPLTQAQLDAAVNADPTKQITDELIKISNPSGLNNYDETVKNSMGAFTQR